MNTDDLRKQAEDLLQNSKGKAAEILEDGGKMDQLLNQVENKLETVPKAGAYLAEVPRMISLLKDHIQKRLYSPPASASPKRIWPHTMHGRTRRTPDDPACLIQHTQNRTGKLKSLKALGTSGSRGFFYRIRKSHVACLEEG